MSQRLVLQLGRAKFCSLNSPSPWSVSDSSLLVMQEATLVQSLLRALGAVTVCLKGPCHL